MILVDTSVWIDHLRVADHALMTELEAGSIGCHELVIEELALGSIKERDRVLSSLAALDRFPRLTHAETYALVQAHRLWSRGLSAVDVHLLGSVRLVAGGRLWTRDMRLGAVAADWGVSV